MWHPCGRGTNPEAASLPTSMHLEGLGSTMEFKCHEEQSQGTAGAAQSSCSCQDLTPRGTAPAGSASGSSAGKMGLCTAVLSQQFSSVFLVCKETHRNQIRTITVHLGSLQIPPLIYQYTTNYSEKKISKGISGSKIYPSY